MKELDTPVIQAALRSCDMVMKGGVTSGVVYPKAIAKLATEFRLRNIGGTSAGAIAAAAAAAAELGRQRGLPAEKTFQRLAELPSFFQATPAGSKDSNLFELFQPQPSTRALFRVLTAPLGCQSLTKGVLLAFAALLRCYPLAATFGALPGLLLVWLGTTALDTPVGVATCILGAGLALVGLCLLPAWRFFCGCAKRIPENNYGLCSGMPRDGSTQVSATTLHGGSSLTMWLTAYLNELAGLTPDGPPLTFGRLWSLTTPQGEKPPVDASDIRLEMLTTCLSWGRPFRLPFRHDNEIKENIFYFRESDFRRLFPTNVVDWMVAHGRQSSLAETWRAQGYRPMPDPWNLPVVVATRMSLSFPVLLSAVPLYAYYNESEQRREARRQSPPRRVWFSDGGICSNFPLHFFDSPLPRWPTFGINLVDKEATCTPEDLKPWMPHNNFDGLDETWKEIDKSKCRVFGFLTSIVQTMQNWSDSSLGRLPGYRDRVAHVGLKPSEGGLNLNMTKDVITALGARGEQAAGMFVERFAHGQHPRMTWANHRWLRLRSTLAAVEELLLRIDVGCSNHEDGDIPYERWVETTTIGAEPSYSWRSEAQRANALRAIRELRQTIATWHRDQDALACLGAPNPRPELRPRPRI